MSLEAAILENTASIKALTEAWLKLSTQAKAISAKVDAGETGNITAGGEPVAEVKTKKPAATPTPKAEPAATSETADAAAAPQSPEPAAPKADAIDFETLKKAFLILSNQAGGRAKCEAVLKPFGVPRLSESSPDQYAAIMANIRLASA